MIKNAITLIFLLVLLCAVKGWAQRPQQVSFSPDEIAEIMSHEGDVIGRPEVRVSKDIVVFKTKLSVLKPKKTTFSVTTQFNRHSPTVEKFVHVSQGKDRDDNSHMYFILDNNGSPFQQALIDYHGIPLQVYERPQDMFVYLQSLDRQGKVELKEWILARHPNCPEGSCYQWLLKGMDFKRRLVFESDSTGGMDIQRQMEISGVPAWDYEKQRHIIDLVKRALKGLPMHIAGEDQVGQAEPVVYWTKDGLVKQGKLTTSIPTTSTPGVEVVKAEAKQDLKMTINEPESNYPLLIDPTLKWGQWLGGVNSDLTFGITINGSSIYAGGYSAESSGWNNQTVTFQGVYHTGASDQGWVVKITDNGSTPTLNWGQWLGGTSLDETNLITNNGSSIYAAGYSQKSSGWNNQTVTFQGVYNTAAASQGWVVKITDNGSTPTLNWGQWLGGTSGDNPVDVAVSGSSIYAGGYSTKSSGWNNQTVTFQGAYNTGASDEAWVVKITDNGSTPTLNWGQWLGGVNQDYTNGVAVNGNSIYAAGFSEESSGWNNQTVTFQGVYNTGASVEGWLVKITDNGSTPTLNWGQWLGGSYIDESTALAINNSSIYVSGISQDNVGWNNQNVTFQGQYILGALTEGWVVKVTDNGTTPTLEWGQWLGSQSEPFVNNIAANGSSIYAGGYDNTSTGWGAQTGTTYGTYKASGGINEAWVAKITDNGTTPTCNWVEWMGGVDGDETNVLAVNNGNIYSGGYSNGSSGWNNQSVTFQGVYNTAASSQGWVTKISDPSSSSSNSDGIFYGIDF